MDLDRIQRLSEQTRRERGRLYAILEEEANPLDARLRRARQEGMDEVTVEDFQQRPKRLRPKRPVAEDRADRLRVLFEKVQREVSLLTLRNVYDKAKKKVRNDPEFRDLKETPPHECRSTGVVK